MGKTTRSETRRDNCTGMFQRSSLSQLHPKQNHHKLTPLTCKAKLWGCSFRPALQWDRRELTALSSRRAPSLTGCERCEIQWQGRENKGRKFWQLDLEGFNEWQRRLDVVSMAVDLCIITPELLILSFALFGLQLTFLVLCFFFFFFLKWSSLRKTNEPHIYSLLEIFVMMLHSRSSEVMETG